MYRMIWPLLLAVACAAPDSGPRADLIVTNGRVYTFAWDDPAPDGTPAANAPFSDGAWRPDAEAVALNSGRILAVGSEAEVSSFRDDRTRVLDARGGTVLPGLVDSHTHVAGLGELEAQIDLFGVETEDEAVERVVEAAKNVPAGEWIVARGWDDSDWASHYPTWDLLNERFPDNPVVMRSLHGFAVWANRKAFEEADITKDTRPPSGGRIVKDENGELTGILLDRAGRLLTDAIPPPTDEEYERWVQAGLERMARDGYVAVHEAGVDRPLMTAFESLEAKGSLPIRVYAMLSARDGDLCREWLTKGPERDNDSTLIVRSVKAYYDGALGSRGARLIEDYSDMPGHKGVAGGEYGFDTELVAEMMRTGFQVGIHAIGDAGNRETLDFLASVIEADPETRDLRNRIEHAQVVHPDDFRRFAELNVIASMEPPHCAEDKRWAEDRLGPERIKGAYAWRTMREVGVRLAFNSDLAGSDHDIFYGLHSAITCRDKELEPPEGWHPEQRVTPEEAVRGYTIWNAYAAKLENETGTLEPGKWADITILDIDPLETGIEDPGALFLGKIVATIVGGKIVYGAE
ncbi:MAG TPA: amidohydrolase [Vicinamibacteria bacterium]|nr:amidohydrolase [Vicinamibacteria bacterium]